MERSASLQVFSEQKNETGWLGPVSGASVVMRLHLPALAGSEICAGAVHVRLRLAPAKCSKGARRQSFREEQVCDQCGRPGDDCSLSMQTEENECFSGYVDAAVFGLLAGECSKYCTVHMHGAAPDPYIGESHKSV